MIKTFVGYALHSHPQSSQIQNAMLWLMAANGGSWIF